MPALTVCAAHLLDEEASTRPIRGITSNLEETLGQRLTAALAGISDVGQIGRHATGDRPEPQEIVERRLREGFKVVRMLVDAYDAPTARAWLFGVNGHLDDRAPIEVLGNAVHDEDFIAVVRAARRAASFLSGG